LHRVDAGARAAEIQRENEPGYDQRKGEPMAAERTGMARVEPTMKAWRVAHPAATLVEIEAEIDRQLATARAALLTDLLAETPAAVPTTCPACGHPLVPRGRHTRQLYTEGGELVFVTRQYARCPACGAGLFPPG
jgi:hypothetical protein